MKPWLALCAAGFAASALARPGDPPAPPAPPTPAASEAAPVAATPPPPAEPVVPAPAAVPAPPAEAPVAEVPATPPAAPPPAASTPPAAPVEPPKVAEADPDSPAGVVEGFHAAMREGYQQGMLDALAPDVLIFEQGYIERSRDEYASGHLHDDMAFAAQTRTRIVGRDVLETADQASVLTLSLTDGRFGDQDVALENTETMVLGKRKGKWKITHIHWSAHPRPAKK